MAYTTVDILDNILDLKNTMMEVFGKTKCNDLSVSQQFYAVVGVIRNLENRYIQYIKQIKKDITDNSDRNLDFDYYDKLKSLIQQFKMRLLPRSFNNLREFINYIIQIWTDTVALLLDIRGRGVRGDSDDKSLSYIALTKLIDKQLEYKESLESISV